MGMCISFIANFGSSGGVGGNVHFLHSKILNIMGVIRSVVTLFLKVT